MLKKKKPPKIERPLFETYERVRSYYDSFGSFNRPFPVAYFNHGYEYMGSNRNVAVVTPLTNRIFLTFTRALMAGLGGAIRGKNPTWKTRSLNRIPPPFRVMSLYALTRRRRHRQNRNDGGHGQSSGQTVQNRPLQRRFGPPYVRPLPAGHQPKRNLGTVRQVQPAVP